MIEIKLEQKAIPIPLIYEPIYKIVMVLAVLKYGCSQPYKATFLKLHLYMWALRYNKGLYILKGIKNKYRKSLVPWNFEPGLEKTVTLCLINKYCEKEIKSNELQIQISALGLKLLKEIEEGDYFKEDINKIKSIGVIPQNTLLQVNQNWSVEKN